MASLLMEYCQLLPGMEDIRSTYVYHAPHYRYFLMKLTNNDHSHWQCSEDDEADHAQHYSKRGGEERERREGRREIIFMPRSHPLVGVTFNLDPPGTNIWTPSEKFVPTIGQRHKGKSVHVSGPEDTKVESTHVKDAGHFCSQLDC